MTDEDGNTLEYFTITSVEDLDPYDTLSMIISGQDSSNDACL